MRQIRMPMNLYRTPCSPAYWHEANLAMKCLKLLVFAALMIAVTRALSLIPSTGPHTRAHTDQIGRAHV